MHNLFNSIAPSGPEAMLIGIEVRLYSTTSKKGSRGSALQAAVVNGCVDVIQLLLDQRAIFEGEEDDGSTFHTADDEVDQLLPDKGAGRKLRERD